MEEEDGESRAIVSATKVKIRGAIKPILKRSKRERGEKLCCYKEESVAKN